MASASLAVPSGIAVEPTFALRIDADARTIVLRGELDAATAPILLDSATAVLDTLGDGELELDMSGVSFLCASGLGAIVSISARQQRSGHAVVVRGARPSSRKVFLAGGLRTLLEPEPPRD